MSMTKWAGFEPLWAPDGAGAGAAAADTGGAAAETGAAAAAAETGAAAQAPAAPWYDALEPDVRTTLINAGWHKGDPLAAAAAAAKGYDHAQRMLGHGPANLVRKPEPGKLDEWLGANAELLGVPGKPEEYQIAKPADLPKGVDWDEGLAAKAAALGFEAKIPPAQMTRMARLYAEHIGEKMGTVEREIQLANSRMEQELERDWGTQRGERTQLAARAFAHVAEAAGIPAEVRDVVGNMITGNLVKAGVGQAAADAMTIRMFAAIGGMMAEDTFKADALGSGGGGGRMTPQEAEARLAEITAKGGVFAQAREKGDAHAQQKLIDEIATLSKIAARTGR